MTTQQKIAKIDRKITTIQKQLRKREIVDLISAPSWQAAWDKHPDMKEAEAALYRRRGQLQIVVGAAQAKIGARQDFTRKRAESKSARKRTAVFEYLHNCKQAAKLLGFYELVQYYTLGLDELRRASL